MLVLMITFGMISLVVMISIDKNEKGYGGLIIIKHKINDFSFYTLFGHLSPNKFNYNVGDFTTEEQYTNVLSDSIFGKKRKKKL